MIELTTEKRPMPGIAYRYSLAFLDSHPKPETDQHVARLIRLMAYDMVLVAGSRGEDAPGIFAAALRGLHATRGQSDLGWQWEYEGIQFSAKPVSCELRPENSLSPDAQNRISSLCSSQWLSKLQELPVPDPSGQLSIARPSGYPSPEHTIEAACLLVLEVATLLSHVQHAKICWHSPSGEGVEVSVDTSHFVPHPDRRNAVNHALGK